MGFLLIRYPHHGAGGHGIGFLDSRLFLRIHARRRRFYRFFAYLNLFIVSMLTLILRQQLRDDVHRLGRGRSVFVFAYRLLLSQEKRERRGEKAFVASCR